ncbi:MAG: Slp family lipoprotein [Proteobacteria bacterium]|nr:Slp family lipoprotein [Pseudomonadota bacterium]MBS0461024.1 Slp family lipoprotein [Pseudomonadota bacterium]MBS0465394.1 Slp family lipoprotein [Pseudomonadota bacterium]
MTAANRRPAHRGIAHRIPRGVATASLLVLLAGCASVPKPLQGQFAAVDPGAAITQDATGQAVRWGGTIAKVENEAGQTCFQLVARPLNEQSRPVLYKDRSAGRFLACRAGFYEPQVFAIGRSVTVTGHVAGYETRRVGEYDYRQPKVAADVIYLWPKVQRVRTVYAYDPFFGPPYPWGPWWW